MDLIWAFGLHGEKNIRMKTHSAELAGKDHLNANSELDTLP